MKALASLLVAAVLACAAVPAGAGPHTGFLASAGRGFGLGGLGRHGGGFSGYRAHGRFIGSSWVFPDVYAAGFAEDAPPPAPYYLANPYRGHFEGASWVVPGAYAPAPPALYYPPAAALDAPTARPARTGPRILYLHGAPTRTGKEPRVIYGSDP